MRLASVIICVSVLASCALPSKRDTSPIEELAREGKLEEAWALAAERAAGDPRNAALRSQALVIRAQLTNVLLTQAEAQRSKGLEDDAVATYRRLLTIDPQNPIALQRLDALLRGDRLRIAITDAENALLRGDYEAAEARSRAALALDSSDPRAREVQRRAFERRDEALRRRSPVHEALRKPVTLDFRDAPLKGVIDVLASTSGVNMVLDKDVKPDQKVTIMVKNTPVRDALELVLLTNQLEYRLVAENSLLVYPSTAQKQREHQSLVMRSFYLTNANPTNVANSIRTLVKTRDIAVDEKLGLMIVKDTPEAIRLIERLVAVQDLAEAEVMLEVEVLEVARSKLLDLGIRWSDQLTLAPLASGGQALTLNDLRNLNSNMISAVVSPTVITARTEVSDVGLLANPRIRARNREKARILIGERVPNITSTSTATGFVSENVQYIDVGLKLEVEPTISLDDEVAIRISLEVSNIISTERTRSGTVAYRIGTRNASTLLRLKDGENQILAGLLSDDERMSRSGLPYVSNPPLLDRLFGGRTDQVQRTEIVLSITPRLVRQLRRPEPSMMEFDAGTDVSARQRSAEAPPPTIVVPLTAPPARPSGATPMPAPPGLPPAPSTPPPPYSSAPSPAPSAVGEPQLPVGSVQPPAAAPAGSGVSPPSLSLRWTGPSQVRVGDEFSAELVIEPREPLQAVPVVIAFDPQVFRVEHVEDGSALSAAGSPASATYRVDSANGQVFASLVRTSPATEARAGTLLTLRMRAVKPSAESSLSILSAQATLPDGRSATATLPAPLTLIIAP
jgi:general secretion pathway protein D